MLALSDNSLRYLPRVTSPPGSALELGRAFERAWHARSDIAERALQDAIVDLVKRLKDDRVPTEQALLAFKTAIRRHGGVHSFPSLVAEEHFGDSECLVTYEHAFSWFMESYFESP